MFISEPGAGVVKSRGRDHIGNKAGDGEVEIDIEATVDEAEIVQRCKDDIPAKQRSDSVEKE